MRLSDAIALGRVLVKRPVSRYFYNSENGCSACARGMACLAIGRQSEAGTAEREVWPWLEARFPDPSGDYGYPAVAYGIINNLMRLVVEGKWTLDQLIDWVRSVEPPEDDRRIVAEDSSITAPAEPKEVKVSA